MVLNRLKFKQGLLIGFTLFGQKSIQSILYSQRLTISNYLTVQKVFPSHSLVPLHYELCKEIFHRNTKLYLYNTACVLNMCSV